MADCEVVRRGGTWVVDTRDAAAQGRRRPAGHAALRSEQAEQPPVIRVPITEIVPGDSPRTSGLDTAHVRRLAECEDPLPPIIVSRATMRVIDGMHRLTAARMRGEEIIDVRFFEADEASAFVLAVRANVTHGLPLSLADRKAAAARILGLYPGWSNRAIAQASGLAANTVGQLRERLTGQDERPDARVGLDGRKRPVNSAERRALAASLMRENTNSSLRDIARRAGISPETARSVRARLSTEAQASPSGSRPPAPAAEPGCQPADARDQVCDSKKVLRAMAADPAIRSSELGRTMLRALAASLPLDDCGGRLAETLPSYRLSDVMLAAKACAAAWLRIVQQLEWHSTERPGRDGAHGLGDATSSVQRTIPDRGSA